MPWTTFSETAVCRFDVRGRDGGRERGAGGRAAWGVSSARKKGWSVALDEPITGAKASKTCPSRALRPAQWASARLGRIDARRDLSPGPDPHAGALPTHGVDEALVEALRELLDALRDLVEGHLLLAAIALDDKHPGGAGE
jgi:hypothetical protein